MACEAHSSGCILLTWESQGIPEGFSAAVENVGNVLSCDMDAYTAWDSLGLRVPGGSGMRMSRWKLGGMKYPAILGLWVLEICTCPQDLHFSNHLNIPSPSLSQDILCPAASRRQQARLDPMPIPLTGISPSGLPQLPRAGQGHT